MYIYTHIYIYSAWLPLSTHHSVVVSWLIANLCPMTHCKSLQLIANFYHSHDSLPAQIPLRKHHPANKSPWLCFYPVTHYNTLQRTANSLNLHDSARTHTATQCNTLQHTTLCLSRDSLQRCTTQLVATLSRNSLQHFASPVTPSTHEGTATLCWSRDSWQLQHIATLC